MHIIIQFLRKSMANLPQSTSTSGASSAAHSVTGNNSSRMAYVENLVVKLSNPSLRANSIHELSNMRDLFEDLAPLLWYTGTIPAILQEIVSAYPFISPPGLTQAHSNRVCKALALLQCVASDLDIRMGFLHACIPLYMYPLLNTTSMANPFENMRLTSLGVIGALVKFHNTAAISFLLSTEFLPLCLHSMQIGGELSKTVGTFIVEQILSVENGMKHICTSTGCLFSVCIVLGTMVATLVQQPSCRLLKLIIRCYLRLSENQRACHALRTCLPDVLRDATFSSCLREHPTARSWLQQLLHNIRVNLVPAQQGGGGSDHMTGS